MQQIVATHTTEDKAYPHYGISAYRIELAMCRTRPLQRHIWTYSDGGTRCDDWIDSFYESEDRLEAKGFIRISREVA